LQIIFDNGNELIHGGIIWKIGATVLKTQIHARAAAFLFRRGGSWQNCKCYWLCPKILNAFVIGDEFIHGEICWQGGLCKT
jgi:hypothetical protein